MSGGLRYQGDYYIIIQPEGAPAPYKALCKAREDGGKWQGHVALVSVVAVVIILS